MAGGVKAEERGLNNSIFRQVTELHVPEGFPWADHCDVSAKTLHARDVISESEWMRHKALMSSN